MYKHTSNDVLAITIRCSQYMSGPVQSSPVHSRVQVLQQPDGKVVKSPDATTSRIVGSLSRQKPHYICLKDGRFECDEECDAFSQRYICAHTIAAAEDNNMLLQFLENYGKFSHTPKGKQRTTPNLTKLSMSGINQSGVGRKGGKAPRKRPQTRRRIFSDESRSDVSVLKSNPAKKKNVTTENADQSHQLPAPKLPPVPSSVTTEPPSDGASISGLGMQYPADPYYNYMAPMGHGPYNPSPFFYGYNHHYFQPPPPPTPLDRQPVPSLPQPNFDEPATAVEQSIGHSQEPFFIQFLNGRIKICYGCKGSYLRSEDGSLLSAPNNICIAHKEPRHFVNPQTGSSNSKNSNAYYHINRSCILKNHPRFTKDDIQCTEEIEALLQPSHIKLLEEALGYLV